nr:MAG TPA: hypothetical protein [Inoviridae sp.]
MRCVRRLLRRNRKLLRHVFYMLRRRPVVFAMRIFYSLRALTLHV